ncbi:amino acid ABC transporter permease [Microbacterium betulae]|uniref:Amino acid ABC transporter permease n=1 Tax=Microbacterium betulae TaxID=2981139 RepID=A0AA97I7D2_9MICO|nr:amino acid ABC transporter permease [Microbacterium sp. AB]WOF23310.1 amino acid ABC transporter permease [Microbacterium sp. AB]
MFVEDWLSWLPSMLEGLWTALGVTILALVVGLPLGALLGIGSSVRTRSVRAACVTIVEVGRGIPALVFLYLVYYGLTEFGLTLTSFAAAVVGIGLTTAAYSSELFRAGFESVPSGEREAARALGMNGFFTMWDVIVPQGLAVALPSLIGLAIQMFQATALAYQIALPELLSRAYSTGTQTFQYLSALALAGLLYLVVTIPLSFLSQRIAAGSSAGGRRRRGRRSRRSIVPSTTALPVVRAR